MIKILFIISAGLFSLPAVAQPNYPAAPAPAPDLSRMEYYFDRDPGMGNGTAIAIPAAQEVNSFSFAADLTGISPGFHRVYVRSLDATGKWSLTYNAFFDNFIVPLYPGAPPAAAPLAEAEYFIDTDPGLGNATKIDLGSALDISSQNIAINVTGLAAGVHRFYIRSRIANGKWSLTNFGIFDNSQSLPYPSAPAPAAPLGQMEYYIDTDPGFGNAIPVSFTAATDINNLTVTIPFNSLAPGEHTLYIRSRQNPWSLSAYASFVFASTLPVTWLYVRGEIRQQHGWISWATGTEINTDKFIVEHSSNGIAYTAIGQVAAAGNSQTSKQYHFQHDNLQPGLHYYRIRQLDLDGQSTYSRVITLLHRNGLRETIVAPNPVKEHIHVIEPANRIVEKTELYDIKGRLVRQDIMGQEKLAYSIPAISLQKGMYILKIFYRNSIKSFTIIKE